VSDLLNIRQNARNKDEQSAFRLPYLPLSKFTMQRPDFRTPYLDPRLTDSAIARLTTPRIAPVLSHLRPQVSREEQLAETGKRRRELKDAVIKIRDATPNQHVLRHNNPPTLLRIQANAVEADELRGRAKAAPPLNLEPRLQKPWKLVPAPNSPLRTLRQVSAAVPQRTKPFLSRHRHSRASDRQPTLARMQVQTVVSAKSPFNEVRSMVGELANMGDLPETSFAQRMQRIFYSGGRIYVTLFLLFFIACLALAGVTLLKFLRIRRSVNAQ